MSPINSPAEQKKKAYKIIRLRTLLTAGAGLIPVPLLDAAGILGIQLWMIRDLARIYDLPFKKDLAKSLIGALVGSIGSVSAVKAVPVVGPLLGGGAVAVGGAAATYALGRIFTQHFAQGGTLLNFDPVKSREYFRQLYEEGKASVKELQEQEAGFNDVHTQALASVSALQKTNEELKTTIAALQNQLQQSKKGRKYAVAALKEKKRRPFRWLGLFLLLIVIVAGAAWLFQAGYFKAKNLTASSAPEQVEADTSKDDDSATDVSKTSAPAAEKVDSMAAETVAPDTSAAILAGPTAAELDFAPGSTEAAMADYMSAVDAVFPKTFPLDAAQFEEGTVELSPEAEAQIANIAALLQNYPAATLRIYGHADQNGGTAANRQAGRNRARLIQEALEKNGVARNRMSATFLEKTAPPDGLRGAEIEVERRN